MLTVVMLTVVMLNVVMLNDVMLSVVYEKCRIFHYYTGCRDAECLHGECRYAECRYAECHSISLTVINLNFRRDPLGQCYKTFFCVNVHWSW
jgi:hypothetical protein